MRIHLASALAYGAVAMALAPVTGSATQIIPSVEYSNDTIQQNGVIQACIVTVALVSPPAPEIVNLQFLVIAGDGFRLAYKVTAGDVNWNEGSSVARRIAAANFDG